MITKKPKKAQKSNLKDDEINALIAKGGEVPQEETVMKVRIKKKATKKVPVQLRLPQQLIDQIDAVLDKRLVNISRHTWFLEAIESKLRAESESI